MSGIRSFEVTQPPTSEEVADLALNAIKKRSLLPLVARSIPTELGPQAEEVAVDVHIKLTQHPENRGMRIVGENALGNTVSVTLSTDSTQPAELHMQHEVSHSAE